MGRLARGKGSVGIAGGAGVAGRGGEGVGVMEGSSPQARRIVVPKCVWELGVLGGGGRERGHR